MGVTFLLDTHVLLWILTAPDRIDGAVRAQLEDRANVLLVSAVSALEIATKIRVGKLFAQGLVESWDERVAGIGAEQLAVSSAHARLAGSMPWAHRDPFDRLLVAQATLEVASLVTVDDSMRGLPAPRIVSW